MFYWIFKIIFGPIIRLIWIKRVEGLENIPKKGACIIAANHQSYFDFICLMAVLPRRIYFLAAEKFFKGKIWGPLVRMTGQIYVDRKSKDKSEVYLSVLSALKQGKIIGIFPEGTRSLDGEIHKAFPGVAKFTLMAKVRVVPVGIKGTHEILSRHRKFPKFRKIAEIKIGKVMDFSGLDQTDENYRIATDKIMKEIASLASKRYL